MATGRTRVYIDADADALEREIRRAEAALERLGREGTENARQASRGMAQATAATSRYARAAAGAATVTSRVGSAARTAAPYLGGGLALGLAKSVVEAREAEKAMSQTEAVIKSTGGVANVTADDIAKLSGALSTKTAVDDEAIQSGANLLLTFKNIRNEAGKNNDIFDQSTEVILDMSAALDQDLKSSAIQVGKALNDPKVGLTALSRVGVTFTEQTKEQITALVEQGDTLKAQKIILGELTSEFGGSAAAQADSFDRLQVAAENFAESVGKEVTPTLGAMSDELADILGDKNLTKDQRLDALGDFFEKWVGNGIEALEDAAPEIASTGAKLGLRAVKGFVSAWWESDLLGKLFLGAGAIRLFGGPGVFGKLGVAMAKRMATSMSTTVATEVAAGNLGGPGGPLGKGMASWVKKAARYAGPLAGVALAIEMGKEFGESGWVQRNLLSNVGIYELLLREIGNVTESELDHLVREAEEAGQKITRSQIRAWKTSGAISATEARQIKASLNRVDAAARESERFWEKWGDTVDGSYTRAGKLAGKFAFRADGSFGKVEKSAEKMTTGVAANVEGMVDTTLIALGVLNDALNQSLSAYGVEKINLGIAQSKKGQGNPSSGFQSGGSVFQVPGHGSGDSFHTAVAPGTFILNREAVSSFFGLQSGGAVPVALEPGELAFSPQAVAQMGGMIEWMNAAVPRFAKGGGVGGLNFALGPYNVPPITYAADHAGSNSHVHITGTTTPWVVGIGKRLQAMGFMVSEHPAFGGVAPPPTHSATGGHYDALAIDVNSPDGESKADVARIAGILGGSGATAQKLRRILLSGPDGPLKSIGQGAIDTAWRGANRYLSANMPTSGIAPKGGKGAVVGSATWFTGTNSASGLNPSTTPGLALNPNPGGPDPQSWDNPTTRRWLADRQKFRVNIGGHTAVLPMIDKGPAGWTGHAIDVTPPGVAALGFTTANFPSGTKGSATPVMRGGRIGFATGGTAPGKGKPGKSKPDFTTKTGNLVPPKIKLPPLGAPVLSYDEQMTQISIALANAEPTETTADDLAALADQADLILDQKLLVESELANLSLTPKEQAKIQKEAQRRAAALQKKLAKDGLTKAEKKQIQQEGRKTAKELQQEALGTKRADLLGKLDDLTGALHSNHDAVLALGEEEAARLAEEQARQQELIDALKSLSDALVAANELAKQEASIQTRELTRALADILSGEIGGQAAFAGMTAGYGSVVAA